MSYNALKPPDEKSTNLIAHDLLTFIRLFLPLQKTLCWQERWIHGLIDFPSWVVYFLTWEKQLFRIFAKRNIHANSDTVVTSMKLSKNLVIARMYKSIQELRSPVDYSNLHEHVEPKLCIARIFAVSQHCCPNSGHGHFKKIHWKKKTETAVFNKLLNIFLISVSFH